MLSRFSMLLLLALLALPLSGCRDSLLDPDSPVRLSFWHVYGAQADSPMNRLVERFNLTEGKEKGIIVNVTSLSNTVAIHFPLVAAAQGKPGAGILPDIFVTYPKTVLTIGADRFADWNDTIPADVRKDFVPSFLEEGMVDGRQVMFPVAKSSRALFVNATIFDRFAAETGLSYDDLITWEGMFKAAEAYHRWSGGKAFFKYDEWMHYSLLNTAALGGDFFTAKKVNFASPQFAMVWKKLARAAVKGHVCMLKCFSTAAMMVGETLCGVESTASILYFKDYMTFPDNTHLPLRLRILPAPKFNGARPLTILAGSSLCIPKSTKAKEYAASIFAQWLTKEENNVPFAVSTGYLPVKNEAFSRIVKAEHLDGLDEKTQELYKTVNRLHREYEFYKLPFFDGYGELEKKFCDEQMALFERWKSKCGGREPDEAMLDAMFEEFRERMEQP
ncbi:MAG: extracellular solute-binding protein [Mailhella sp.]|nr:extracellular solute-binding protein [Mailhella sp.]MBQ4615292.1 extracellular solute-binding protein [Mailhella sp.]